MKKRTLLTILMLLAVVAAVGAVFWRHILPRWQVSDIYRRYEHVDGIAASYIHNYPVNDTLSLNVTLLEATTDSGWAVLVRDFEMDELSPLLQMLIDRGENLVFSKLIPRSNPSASAENDVLAYSYTTRSVSIFHVANDEEKHAVLYHNIKKSINKDSAY
jgi:hypothetical protein